MSDSLEPISITDVEGFSFGHWTNREAATGCTVIVAPHGAAAGVDVRGGAPASRETDLLRPENTVEQVHAVCLSGGSAFGLEAATGCTVIVAPHGAAAGLAEGTVGAGTGATVGKLLGMDRAMKGGLGARAFSLGALKVGAISAVNACGNVIDPVTLEPVAGARVSADGTRIVDLEEGMLDAGANLTMPLDRTNTTISCIVTNARLTKAQATKVAQMAADAYAHVIRPTHTTNDGDTIYVLASGGADAPACPLDLLGLVATRALEAALVAGCREAEGICGLPAARDL